MKLKNILCAAFLSVAVAIVFCGCGPSEEEVYEHLARVEEKANKIEKADLSMDQGFQEKWDLLKRKQAAADRAFSKNDYSTTAKFLQEAESAADWILNQGALRAEADEQYSVLQSRKRESNGTDAPKYASTIYAEAEKYEQQGREAYEKIEFEKATRLYVLAANEYKKATSTASAFHAAVYEMNAAKEIADMEPAPSRYAPAIYQEALSYSQQAVDANAQGKYDEALQLLEVATETFERTEKESQKNISLLILKTLVKIEEKDYYIGKYEVTQAQWRAVMGNNPSSDEGDTLPVTFIEWHDAMEFCKKLNAWGYVPQGYKFSLPTGAQWEYAARGGNKSKGYRYSGSNDINEVAWYGGNSHLNTRPVGEKKPNELGLYDMSGNVWEWCLDLRDSRGNISCGGSVDNSENHCTVGARSNPDFYSPAGLAGCRGFRLALVPVQ